MKKEKIDCGPIIERMKARCGTVMDKDIARLLGISRQNFSGQKKSDSLIGHIMKWAIAENIDLNWLFTGKSEEERQGTGEAGPLDMELLTDTIQGIERFLKENKRELVAKDKARLIAILYDRFASAGEKASAKVIASYLKLVA